jgi:hypothetical protein
MLDVKAMAFLGLAQKVILDVCSNLHWSNYVYKLFMQGLICCLCVVCS